MAQSMFQMRSLQHDVKHEKLQGFRQKALLFSVSVLRKSPISDDQKYYVKISVKSKSNAI